MGRRICKPGRSLSYHHNKEISAMQFHAKTKIRITPLRKKKGRANFIALVMKCISPETVLTKEMIKKILARTFELSTTRQEIW
jgi:hypothetical protein